MAASRSSRVTRSSVGLNGLDENFCGRTLRNRSIAQPEESPVSPPPRARSPKKRQDRADAKTQEDGKQEGKSDAKLDIERDTEESDKIADSNSSSEGEQWSASRKRGASCLEKDGDNNNKSENCENAKGASRENSPQLKRAKRCSRSADTQGQEEEQTVPKAKENASETNTDSNGEDLSISGSSKDSIKEIEEEEEGGEETRDGQVECDGAKTNSYKASNGLKNQDETSTESSTNCLLNGGQSGDTATSAAPSPDPSVPCSNSNMESQNPIAAEEFIVAKEQEISEVEEVDVLGDHLCLAREEQVVESNGQSLTPPRQEIPSPVMNNSPLVNNSNSGEATPNPSPPPPPESGECNATFSELYEHRYTLRTPPKKAATNGGSASPNPPSCASPVVTDNGPTTVLREDGEVAVEDVPLAETLEEICELGASEETRDSGEPMEELATKQETCTEELVSRTTTTAAEEEEDEEEEEEEPDVYYFESDHLALKHNKDYQRLLQTIGVLEAQRTQAILDLEALSRHQRDALDDPITFVEQLQKQVNLGLPCPQRVVQLPDLSWEQYTSGLGDFEREFCDKKRKTRRLQLIFDKGLPLRPKSPVEPKKEGECSSMYSPLPTSDGPENSSPTQMIRGRICHPNKPDTFNQLWTVEEQKKLELLLMKFPPEEVESRRWQKIADELGNRTAKQVASRVQKYFIKLTKAGIPVPGRIPNLCMYTKKASTKRQHHLNKHLYRPSTFMASYEPPVYMDEEDERASFYSGAQDPAAEESVCDVHSRF